MRYCKIIQNNIKIKLFVYLILMYTLFVSNISFAHDKDQIDINADKLTYYNSSGDISAQQNIEIFYNDEIMISDKAYYKDSDKVLFLSGNVAILRPKEDVFFADKLLLFTKEDKGIATNFMGRFALNSLVASKSVEIDKKSFIMKDPVLSPCKICKDNIIKYMPLWRIKAKEAKLDTDKEEIYYKHARFEVMGIPVLYTPYLSTPAPSIKRKTGFLLPLIGYRSRNMGRNITVPFYLNISHNKDATFGIRFTKFLGNVYHAEFRHLTDIGKYQLNISGTRPNKVDKIGIEDITKRRIRGHYEFEGSLDMSDSVSSRFLDIKSKKIFDKSKTYLAKYEIGERDYHGILNTDILYQNFARNYHYSARFLHFQGLRDFDNGKLTPMALPLIQGYYKKNIKGSLFYYLDGSILNLRRSQGTSYLRASATNALAINDIIVGDGHVLNFNASLRSDIYRNKYHEILVKDHKYKNLNKTGDNSIVRMIPTLNLKWNMSLYKRIKSSIHSSDTKTKDRKETNSHNSDRPYNCDKLTECIQDFISATSITIDPIVQMILMPKEDKNNSKIINEDSQEPELSTSNLFSINRFTGIDRVEYGKRINYGVKVNISGLNINNISAVVGQSYRLSNNISDFDKKSGLRHRTSDYVSQISINPTDNLYIVNNLRLDRGTLLPMRHAITVGGHYKKISMENVYIAQNKHIAANNTSHNKEIFLNVGYQISDLWNISGSIHRKLGKRKGRAFNPMIKNEIMLQYSGDCLGCSLRLRKDYDNIKDLKPSTSYQFTCKIPYF